MLFWSHFSRVGSVEGVLIVAVCLGYQSCYIILYYNVNESDLSN